MSIVENRKAFHDYFIENQIEAGIVLTGTEIKSIRKGAVNLRDSYVSIKNGEAYVHNMHISEYTEGNRFNVDVLRSRKLLLHKHEIAKLLVSLQQKGFTLVPLNLHWSRGKVKLEIGVARGKNNYDKRNSLKEKDIKREVMKESKERFKY